VLLVAGVVLFVALWYQLGIGAVWSNVRAIGWGFVPIIGQELLAATCNTLAWWWAFPAPRPARPLRTLFAARVIGDGINAVTPTATLGGEYVRGRLLLGAGAPAGVWASVAVGKIAQTVAQVTFVIGGLFVLLDDVPLPPVLRTAVLAGASVFAGAVALTVALQRRGLFTAGARVLARLGFALSPHVLAQLAAVDGEIRRLYAAPASFLWSWACFLAGWLCGVLEIYLILHFLGVGATWERAFTIEVLSIGIDGVLFFVPARAGTQEGGKVLIFTLLGLDPVKGFALGLARRIRELTWAGVGLALLARHETRAVPP
jgi:hypothetical protein